MAALQNDQATCTFHALIFVMKTFVFPSFTLSNAVVLFFFFFEGSILRNITENNKGM